MTILGTVLRHLATGSHVPVDIARQLSAEEVTALRTLEYSLESHHSWRVMSMKLLDVAHLLGKGLPPHKVFQEIVTQAAKIIGTDIGYISLNDPETNMTSILATHGVVTEQFRTISMPMGSGILGIVAATNKPAWTYDHSADPQVTHVPEVDEAVRAEGIHGILGAPIQLGGTTIGALLVGDRRPRRFTSEDITALAVLGSLTAAAIEIAQTLEAERTAVDSLTSTRETLRAHVADLERLVSADRDLLGLLSASATFEDLATHLSELLDQPVALRRADHAGEGDIVRTPAAIPAPARDEFRHRTAVEFNGRQLGEICTTAEPSRIDEAIVHHACSAFTAIALFSEELAAATSRKVDDLVYAAAIGTIGPQEVARLRQLTGIDLDKPENLYFVGVHDPTGRLTRFGMERKLRGQAAITKHDQHFCLLVQASGSIHSVLQELVTPDIDTADAVVPTVPSTRAPGAPASGTRGATTRGAGSGLFVSAVPVAQSRSIQDAHDMALEFVKAARTLGLHSQVVTEEQLGTVGMILGADERAIGVLTERSIAPLVEYDAANGSELEKTAYQYFLCGHSIPATAKALFVHSNTIRQRLERITELLGAGWDSGARSLDIHMALRVRALRFG